MPAALAQPLLGEIQQTHARRRSLIGCAVLSNSLVVVALCGAVLGSAQGDHGDVQLTSAQEAAAPPALAVHTVVLTFFAPELRPWRELEAAEQLHFVTPEPLLYVKRCREPAFIIERAFTLAA